MYTLYVYIHTYVCVHIYVCNMAVADLDIYTIYLYISIYVYAIPIYSYIRVCTYIYT